MEKDDSMFLVSGSQDNYIRIWNISPLNDTKADEFEIRKQILQLDDKEYW